MLLYINSAKAGTYRSEPADNVSSIFGARRDLLLAVRTVVKGSGFSVEESDLLIALYGVRMLDWNDLAHDEEGYVLFHELEVFLVHNPSLLSRRIRKLASLKPALVEIASVSATSGLHRNSNRVRISKEGVKRVEPIWTKFCEVSSKILDGIPRDMLEAHFAVNEEISARIRKRRAGMKNFLS